MYTVAEENLEVNVCATLVGLTEVYPKVTFVTATSENDSG